MDLVYTLHVIVNEGTHFHNDHSFTLDCGVLYAIALIIRDNAEVSTHVVVYGTSKVKRIKGMLLIAPPSP